VVDRSCFVGIDWSGAASEQAQRMSIWLAEYRNGTLSRLRHGFTRESVTGALLRLVDEGHSPVVGLDFGFGFPVAALNHLRTDGGPALWEAVVQDHAAGEAWFDGSSVTGLGRELAGIIGPPSFRQTEADLQPLHRPRSTLALEARTGNVGRQTVRGFRQLLALHGKYAIWPFDVGRQGPVVVEVYPAALRQFIVGTQGTSHTRADVVRALRRRNMPAWAVELADADENAMDALIAATALHEVWNEGPPAIAADSLYAIEGRIWMPHSRDPAHATDADVADASTVVLRDHQAAFDALTDR
jgi:hypothetical protein